MCVKCTVKLNLTSEDLYSLGSEGGMQNQTKARGGDPAARSKVRLHSATFSAATFDTLGVNSHEGIHSVWTRAAEVTAHQPRSWSGNWRVQKVENSPCSQACIPCSLTRIPRSARKIPGYFLDIKAT